MKTTTVQVRVGLGTRDHVDKLPGTPRTSAFEDDVAKNMGVLIGGLQGMDAAIRDEILKRLNAHAAEHWTPAKKVKTGDSRKSPPTSAELNKINADFWAKRS